MIEGLVLSKRTPILVLLVALSAFNQFDRQLTSVLLEPIRHEFGLSDIALGLLSGLAFAVLYAAASIPASIAATRRNRPRLIALSTGFWGAMTFISGLAPSYWVLLAGRIGIGLGEAGSMPASHAIISDLYAPHERNRALAAWSSGVNMGIFFAFFLGGAIGQFFGWRAAFLVAGTATLVLAVLTTRIKEPVRAEAHPINRNTTFANGLIGHTLRRVASDRPLRHILFGSMLTSVAAYGEVAWASSFFQRVHGLSLASVGLFLAFAVGVGGAVGTLLGGLWLDRLQRRRADSGFVSIGSVYALAKPIALTCFLTASEAIAIIAFVPLAFICTLFVGPSLAILHNRVPPHLRPVASALFLMAVNLVGMGVGPLLIGIMSQLIFRASGAHALGYAMAAMQAIGLWGSLHFFIAGRVLHRGENARASRFQVDSPESGQDAPES